MARRFKKRKTAGKTSIKHAGTLISAQGSGSIPTKLVLVDTNAGARTEATQQIKADSGTDEECNTGDIVRYVNIHLQGASRNPTDNNTIGWLEYAVVCKRDSEPDISIAQTGTLTLGVIATNLYRNDCLWTGFFPIGASQPNGAELRIKIPDAWATLKIGFEYVLFTWFRSQNSASMSTDAVRQISSYNFKAYS